MSQEPFSLEDFLKLDPRFSMDLPVSVRTDELGGLLELRILPKCSPRELRELPRSRIVALRKGELGGLLETRLKPCPLPPPDDSRSGQESDLELSGCDA